MLKDKARVLSAIVAVLLFIGSAFSCAGQPQQTVTGDPHTESASAETSETSILDTLPEINLDGITVNALARNNSWWQLTEISAPELNGEVGSDGNPVITAGSDRFLSVYDKVVSLFSKNDLTIIEYEGQAFMDGRALLCGQVMACVRLFRPMEDDFGIIPLPKYDEAQERYYSYVIPYDIFSASVPVTVKDTSVSGSVLQALAVLSAYYITPAYYEITITGKGLRDEESAEMLDIILASTVYDLARMYDWGAIASGLTGNIIGGREFASYFAKREKAATKALDKTIEVFKSNNN